MAGSLQNNKGFSRAKDLSSFYGTVIVLLGIVIPVTEALRSRWLSNHLVAVFVTYLYAGASVFIVYLLIHESILKKKHLKQLEEDNDYSPDDTLSDDFQPSVNAPQGRRRGFDNLGLEPDAKSSDNETRSTSSGSGTDVPNQTNHISNNLDSNGTGKTSSEDFVGSARRRGHYDINVAPSPIPQDPKDEPDHRQIQPSGNPDDGDTESIVSCGEIQTVCSNNQSAGKSSVRSRGVAFVDTHDNHRNRSAVHHHHHHYHGPRFSTFRPRSGTVDNQAPDDVYNYIAMHMGTATLVNEGTSSFLKAGSLVFAMANLVYVALRIEGDHKRMRECNTPVILYPHYMHLVFIVIQTFFLLKECTFVLRQKKAIASFGLAHLVATNLCVWLRFLMIEVVESLEHRAHDKEHHDYDKKNYTDPNETWSCEVEPISSTAGPYLFPFILEYSLVAMSACSFMFSSINIRVSMEMYRAVLKALRRKKDGSTTSASIDSVDDNEEHVPCSKAHTGLFVGVLILSGTVISMIMFFYLNGEKDYDTANLCYTASENVLLILLLVATILGFIKINPFVADMSQSNDFDHSLLLLSVSFYVILELFQLFSSVSYFLDNEADAVDILDLSVIVLSLIQATVQAMFILDGMQRVAVLGYHKRNKHGRGVITFLIVANVAAWVFKSFQEKVSDSELEYTYYGDIAWTIIRSVALPLVLFFRFHSSICLAHMWHHCYQSEVDDIMQTQMLL